MSGINFPVGVTRTIARLGLKLKQYAPEILMGVGVVAVVGVAVTAIRATLKVEEVLDHHEEQISSWMSQNSKMRKSALRRRSASS